jgi:hypothetical protein
MVGCLADKEAENKWKEAVVAYFGIPSQHLPENNEQNPDKNSGQSVLRLRFESGTSQINREDLPLEPTCMLIRT